MRLILMGTGPFAVPTFRELYATRHEIVALVTSPIRMQKGKSLPPISLVRDLAHEHTTPIFEPEDINDSETHIDLLRYSADLMVVCDYGQILSSPTLATAQLGGINLHASLLPKYRGAAPINWALYNGDSQTGVTVIHMTPKVDAGPCIAQAVVDIYPEETAVELETRLAGLGAWLVRRTIDALKSGNLESLPQNPALASKAPRLKKTDGAIDWSKPAVAIKNQIRALEPWPKTYTFWQRPTASPMRLILGPAEALDLSNDNAPPGTVIEAKSGRLLIATGSGLLSPKSIQPVGKRLMSIDEFLRGNRIQAGDKLGAE
jgi:methionyl-tRNA formyltransferase